MAKSQARLILPTAREPGALPLKIGAPGLEGRRRLRRGIGIFDK